MPGDKSRFCDAGLEEADTATYKCPVCGAEKEVAEEYSLESRCFFPIRFADTMCSVCDEEYMDKIYSF